MSRHSILSNAQREAILAAQFDLHEREVARYWTLSDQDLLRNDRRRDSNRFGFALQLCLLRFPGWPPNGSTLPSLAPTTGGNTRVTSISLASLSIQALQTGQDSVGRFSELRPGRTPPTPALGSGRAWDLLAYTFPCFVFPGLNGSTPQPSRHRRLSPSATKAVT